MPPTRIPCATNPRCMGSSPTRLSAPENWGHAVLAKPRRRQETVFFLVPLSTLRLHEAVPWSQRNPEQDLVRMNAPQIVTAPAAIHAEGLTKRYGEVLAVDG